MQFREKAIQNFNGFRGCEIRTFTFGDIFTNETESCYETNFLSHQGTFHFLKNFSCFLIVSVVISFIEELHQLLPIIRYEAH